MLVRVSPGVYLACIVTGLNPPAHPIHFNVSHACILLLVSLQSSFSSCPRKLMMLPPKRRRAQYSQST